MSRPNAGRTRKTRGKSRRTGTRRAWRLGPPPQIGAGFVGEPLEQLGRRRAAALREREHLGHRRERGLLGGEGVERVGERDAERAPALDVDEAGRASRADTSAAVAASATRGVHPARAATVRTSSTSGTERSTARCATRARRRVLSDSAWPGARAARAHGAVPPRARRALADALRAADERSSIDCERSSAACARRATGRAITDAPRGSEREHPGFTARSA